MEQPFRKLSFWAGEGPQFTRCHELNACLPMSGFTWHTELACRKWFERAEAVSGRLNAPKTTAWIALLSYVNPVPDPSQQFGLSPGDAPDVAILRAYQLLLSGLNPAQQIEENPLPNNLTDFLVRG